MKATELRIGNYVQTDIHGVGTVEAISGLKILYSRNYNSLDIEYFEPIPLTEKWLLDFGFEKSGMAYRKFAFFINKWTKGELMYGYISGNIELKHVHQLQNLYFALTNRELTIK